MPTPWCSTPAVLETMSTEGPVPSPVIVTATMKLLVLQSLVMEVAATGDKQAGVNE